MESKQQINLVRRWPLWFSLSGVVILGGLLSVATRGINWGIDFKGGALFEYRLAKPVADNDESRKVTSEARRALREAGLRKSQIQLSDRDLLIVRTEAKDRTQAQEQQTAVTTQFEKEFGGVEWVGTEMVGPVIGRELKKRALIGTILGCCLILLYVTIRYELRFAVAGIVALLHDVLVMVGVLSFLQVEVDSTFVAALLTVVGYSINDSVVIFDRIRENMKLRRRDPFDEVVNDSLWQTMPRSINTTLTVEFVLLAMLLFGGATIRDLTIALLIGVTCGVYSTVFVASPLLVVWRSASDRRRRVAVPQRTRQVKAAPKATSQAPTVATAATPATTVAAPAPAQGEDQGEDQDEPAGTVERGLAPAVDQAAAEEAASRQKRRPSKQQGKRKRRH